MSKRLALTLSDDAHAQVKARAHEAGLSMHAWIVAAVEREAFRQLCDKQARWNAEHPEAVLAATEDYHRRQEWRADAEAGRDSSAA